MTIQKNQSISLAKGQKGAVLIISLMLLLVMTLLALSSMNTSTMQEKMAANAQNNNRTFQAAESAIGALLNDVLGGDQTQLSTSMTATNNIAPAVAFDIGDTRVAASSQAEYLGEIILTSGSSLNADESTTLLKGHRFELTGIGNIDSVQAQTVIRQGMEYR